MDRVTGIASELGTDGPQRVNKLSETAHYEMLFTKGEPMIDPTELIDGASE